MELGCLRLSCEGHRVEAAEAESYTAPRAFTSAAGPRAPCAAPFHRGSPRQAGEARHFRERTHLPGAGRGAVPAAWGPHVAASRRARVSPGRRPAPSLPAAPGPWGSSLPRPRPALRAETTGEGWGVRAGVGVLPALNRTGPGPGALLRPREKGCQSPWLSKGDAGRSERRSPGAARSPPSGSGCRFVPSLGSPSPPASPRSWLYKY